MITSLAVSPFYASINQYDIVAKRYSKTQTSLDHNTCTVEGKDINSNLNCVNISPQTLGIENQVDDAVRDQIHLVESVYQIY